MFSTSAMEKTVPFVLVSYHPEGFMSTLKAGVRLPYFYIGKKMGVLCNSFMPVTNVVIVS